MVRCAKGFLDLCASHESGDRVDVAEQAAALRRVDSLSLTESSGPPVPRIYVSRDALTDPKTPSRMTPHHFAHGAISILPRSDVFSFSKSPFLRRS